MKSIGVKNGCIGTMIFRIPVSNMSFERPNLPVLIKEIEDVGTVQ